MSERDVEGGRERGETEREIEGEGERGGREVVAGVGVGGRQRARGIEKGAGERGEGKEEEREIEGARGRGLSGRNRLTTDQTI